MNLSDQVVARIRTFVPYAIGAALGWVFAVTGLDLTGDFQFALVAFSVAAVTNGWYITIRLIESRWPLVGVLLGFPKAPTYAQVDNLWASFVRTAIPTLVGAAIVTVAGLIARAVGFELSPDNLVLVIAAAVAIVESLYWQLAKVLLTRWPGLSWLLGTGAQPVYKETGDTETVAKVQVAG